VSDFASCDCDFLSSVKVIRWAPFLCIFFCFFKFIGGRNGISKMLTFRIYFEFGG